MTNALITIVSFLVTVGVLVVIHEFGHYLAARWVGVKILRFSIGFGRALAVRRLGRDRTEWVLAAIPLGGYVKMLDEREGDVPKDELDRAFNRQGVGARIFIVLAGPVANFLLAWLIYWGLFVAGLPGMKPVVGDPPRDTPAAMAGLANGDTIRALADEPVFTWNDVRWLLLKEAVKREPTTIEVETQGGARVTRNLDLSGISKDDLDRDFLGKLGLRPFRPRAPAILGRLLPGSAAERAGLATGDRVVSISGRPIGTWFDFTAEVSASPGRTLALQIERSGRHGDPGHARHRGRRRQPRRAPRRRGAARAQARIRAHDHDGALRADRRHRQGGAQGLRLVVVQRQDARAHDRRRRFVEEPFRPDHHRRLRGTVGATRLAHLARLPRAGEREPRSAQPAADSAPRWGTPGVLFRRNHEGKSGVRKDDGNRAAARPGAPPGTHLLRVLQRPQSLVHRLSLDASELSASQP
jgi:membrane-associated protease RseP (regulator of RpoE activity)